MATARNSRVLRTIPFILIVVLFCPFAHGKLIRVDDNGQADFDNIQAGIDNAEIGDTILVVPGEYVITEPITFRGKAITVRSGAGQDETTIRMGTPADPTRGSVVIFENNETDASILEGFTITGGSGSLVIPLNELCGGGVLFDASSGTVMNCTIVQNSAKHGGGVIVYSETSTTLIDCAVVENTAKNGGGVMVYSGSSTILTNCMIRGNSATGITFGVDGYGGGLFCGPSSMLTVTNCTITGNSGVRGGGGIHCWQNLYLTLTNCTIMSNTVQYAGGGILCDSGSANLTNCVIARNTGATWGGGVMCAFPEASITISNCTIWGNSATEGGGVGCWTGSSATVTNSILWENTATTGNEIYLEQAPTEFSVTYSDVADGQNGVSVQGGTLNWGTGNINADPLFAEPGCWADINDPNIIVGPDDPNAVWIDGDYHLKSEAGRWTSVSSVEPDPNSNSWVLDDITSPCIDRGDPNSPVGDEPMPNGGIINMGAYGGTREASMSTGSLQPLPPEAQWKLDETEGDIAYDSAGEYDGTLYGKPLWQPEGGIVGGAIELDGVDDYITVPFVLNPADGAFSVFAWIQGGAPSQVIVSQEGGASWLMADPTDGALRTNLRTPEVIGRNAKPAGPPLICSTVVTDGDWYRVGFVRDNSNRILYVDDIEVARDTATNLEAAGGGLYIGTGSGLEPSIFFSGLIDDVRIYNRAVKP